MKHKSRIHPSLDLDISFQFTKIIDCMTKEHTSMMVDKLERLKNEKFEKILIPEFEYEVEGNILTQRVEYIKGRKCGMTVKKYRDKIYQDLIERDSDWTFCDFNYDNPSNYLGYDQNDRYSKSVVEMKRNNSITHFSLALFFVLFRKLLKNTKL